MARWDEAWKLSAVDASQWEEIRNVLGEEAQLRALNSSHETTPLEFK